MRIAWLNDRADFVGGAERYVAGAAELLAARGHENHLLYGVAGWMEPAFTKRFRTAFPMVDVAGQLRELAPDVVFAHQVESLAAIRAVAASGIPAARYFHDHRLFCLREHKYTTLGHRTCTRPIGLHCYPCLGFLGRGPDRRGLRLRTLGELTDAHRAHAGLRAFVVGSAYMAEHVAAHGFERKRIHVLSPFVSLGSPEVGASAPAAASERGRAFLFVGALLRGKGLDVLLRALAALAPDVSLTIVGDGAQRAELESLAATLGLTARVRFEGSVGREVLEAHYRSHACLVVPSRTPETFGLTGPEAMLTGLPVIASAVGGMGEWLTDGETGYAFPSGDTQALAAAMERVLADPARARAMTEAGAAQVRARFSPARHGEALAALLESVRAGDLR